MAKHWETFEETHARAMRAAHEELFARLDYDLGLPEDQFIAAVQKYGDVMGYFDEDGEHPGDPDDRRWIRALHRAWKKEVREKRGHVNLGEMLDRCIRATTIAIGERWPKDKSTAKVAQISRKAA